MRSEGTEEDVALWLCSCKLAIDGEGCSEGLIGGREGEGLANSAGVLPRDTDRDRGVSVISYGSIVARDARFLERRPQKKEEPKVQDQVVV